MHQRYHLALHAPLTLSRIHSEESELKALKSALQRYLPVLSAIRSSGFSQIAVTPSDLAAYPRRLIYGEKRSLGCGSFKQTLNVHYHAICSGAIEPKRHCTEAGLFYASKLLISHNYAK